MFFVHVVPRQGFCMETAYVTPLLLCEAARASLQHHPESLRCNCLSPRKEKRAFLPYPLLVRRAVSRPHALSSSLPFPSLYLYAGIVNNIHSLGSTAADAPIKQRQRSRRPLFLCVCYPRPNQSLAVNESAYVLWASDFRRRTKTGALTHFALLDELQ